MNKNHIWKLTTLAVCVFLQQTSSVIAMGRAEYYELSQSQDIDFQKNFIVSLRNYSNPKQRICLGTIINRKLILTAAHCIIDKTGKKNYPLIVAGTFMEDYGTDPKSVSRNVTNIHIHPSYEQKAASNDLAILELNQTLEYYETNMSSAIIAEQIPEYPECFIYGWGCETNQTKIFQKLRKRIILLDDRSECQKRYGSNFYQNEVCSDYFGSIFCGNDTGGPVMCDNRLVAVVSYISDHDVYPNLYIVVSRHIGFMHNPVSMLQFYSKARKKAIPISKWKLFLDTFIILVFYNIVFQCR